ncbi:MAG: adenylate/guanylate cyclase domain-containing protein [Actinomycetota bacterium]|nr:adenylate/guanylate cyclase domain-containing protein [Actinomycetota bacterium]
MERRVTAGPALYSRMRRGLTVAMVGANMLGAVLVFVFLTFVVPTPTIPNAHHVTVVNLSTFIPVLFVELVVGVRWSLRISAGIRDWLSSDRPPTVVDRDLALRHPMKVTTVIAGLWGFAAVVFGVLNSFFSRALGIEIGVTIALGGLGTAAVCYLVFERLHRPVTARALAQGPPAAAPVPGVAARLVLAWAFGTSITVVGAGLVAGAYLFDNAGSPRRLAATIVFLAVTTLIAGLATVIIAARSIADPVDSVRRALAEVEAGNVGVDLPVFDGSEIGLLQAGFNKMIAAVRERDRIRDLFGRHVGEDVARAALDRGVALGGEERDVAVLFVDVVGSTAFAAAHEPSVVVDALNRFFAVVVQVVTGQGGWVNKFEGDAALCVFGAPNAHANPSAAALTAARELHLRLTTEVEEIDAAIGISAGRVVAGNIGAAERFEYTVIGDPVNEASRLTDLAKTLRERVVASAAIVREASAPEASRWVLREPVSLRGRDEPTPIAVVLADAPGSR